MDMWSYSDLQDSATGFWKLSNFVTYKGSDVNGTNYLHRREATVPIFARSLEQLESSNLLSWKIWKVVQSLLSTIKTSTQLFQHFPTIKNWLGSTNSSQHEGLVFLLLMVQKSCTLRVIYETPVKNGSQSSNQPQLVSELNPDFWWNHQLLPPPPRVGRCWSFFGVACKAAADGRKKISALKTPGVNRNPSEIMARKHKICSNQL